MSPTNLNRRNFLRNSLLTATGAMLTGKAVAGNQPEPASIETKSQKGTVITRTLGRTGYVLPIVSMGVMRSDNPALVKAAINKGITFFDTANGYQEGNSEKMLGEVFKDYPRDSFVIATKVGPPGVDRRTGLPSETTTTKGIIEKFDISLQRLNLEYVDILYIHGLSTREAVMHDQILGAVKQLKAKGKIRFAGISTHTNMHLVMDAAIEAGVYDVILTSFNYQMAGDAQFLAALERTAAAGLGIVGMKSMAGGFLDKERQKPVNTKAALKWVLNNPNIHTTIPGFTTFEQLDESFAVMENIQLSDQEIKDLELNSPTAGLFCDGCNECVAGCSRKLPIPDLMRAYMYTYGYRDLQKAQDVLLSGPAIDSPLCDGCEICTARCHRGFIVNDRIADVARLRTIPREFLA
jgi:aryl-alcohol dehydrogenase-like predicted oxidoreductase